MASQEELIEDLQEELICPICKEHFTDPVSIECGHSFCHNCLLRTWKEASNPFSCPECRTVSQLRDFQVNLRLGKLAVLAKKLRLHCFQCPGGLGKREVHQKVQKLFCEDDQSPVGVSCSQDKNNEVHRLQCMNEAAKNFRGKLQETMTDLWRKIENVEQQIAAKKVKLTVMDEELEIQKQNVLSEFQKMQQFLEEEKIAYVSHIKHQGKTSLEDLNKTINGLTHQSQEIRKRILKLEEKCQRPDVELLHDVKDMLKKNEFELQKEIEICSIKMTVLPISGILERVFNFKVDITLDYKTADPGLIISEDLKSVRYAGNQEEVLTHGARFRDFSLVLGSQSFMSRRCYWEVEVPDNISWCVGICKKSKESQHFFGLLNVKKENSYYLVAIGRYNLYSQGHFKSLQLSVPNLKVGIFLDYERGEISFYHVKERYLIYTFPRTFFSGPLTPFFSLSQKSVSQNDCFLRIFP